MAALRKIRLQRPAWRIHRDPAALPRLPTFEEMPLNRFDDPERKYSVRYWATNKKGAFLEVLARFRSDAATQTQLGAVKNVDERTEPAIKPGTVPRAFLQSLKEATGQIKSSTHEFVDVASTETQTVLNKHARVRAALKESGITDLDEGAIRLSGPLGRRITQAVSRVVYDGTETAGIHYTSRLDAKEPCWAVFDWVEVTFSKAVALNPKDADPRAAAVSLGLTLP